MFPKGENIYAEKLVLRVARNGVARILNRYGKENSLPEYAEMVATAVSAYALRAKNPKGYVHIRKRNIKDEADLQNAVRR